MKNKIKIRKGDTVQVISGAHRGAKGKVIEVLAEQNRVRIEGVAPIKKHIKPQRNPKHPEGGIIEAVGSVHVSNVMLFSETLGRPVRTGFAFDVDGNKDRVVRGRDLKTDKI